MRAVRASRAGQLPRAGDLHAAALAIDLEGKIEPVVAQIRRQPLRPFDEKRTLRDRVVEADLVELASIAEPIEVGMRDLEARQRMVEPERKGRALHLERRIAGERAEKRAGEGRLAGAEPAGERYEIARLQNRGDIFRQARGRRFVRKPEARSDFAQIPRWRGGHRHSAATAAAAGTAGRRTIAVVPLPSSERISMSPP